MNADTGATVWMKADLGEIKTSPCVNGHKVFVGTSSGFVYCFDVDTGTLMSGWPVNVYSPVTTAAKVLQNRLYVGTEAGTFWCFRLDSSTAWSPFNAGATIIGAPAIGFGYVWFGSTNGNLYCVDITSGQIKPGWPITTGYSNGSVPAIGNQVLYYKSDILNVLDSLSGNTAATSSIPPKVLTNSAIDTNVINDFFSSHVYAGNNDDKIYKTWIKSLSTVWSKQLAKIDDIDSTPSITENRVYLNANGNLYVIDASNGEIKAIVDIRLYNINEKLTSIAIAYERLYFASTSCTIYAYGCCKLFERYPERIILIPSPSINVRKNCDAQFTAIVIANDNTPMPELSSLIEYYCTPTNMATIDVKIGLLSAGGIISPPSVNVWVRLQTAYLTNLGNTINVNLISPQTIVAITP